MSKTVVIAGASQGWGHMKAAFNIASELNLRTDLTVEIVDVFDYLPKALRFTPDYGWRFATHYLHPLYSYAYNRLLNSSDKTHQPKWGVQSHHNIVEILYGRVLRRIIRKLEELCPAVYVSTHPIASFIGSYLKEKFGYKFCIVSTDFIIHTAHIAMNADAFFVPPEFQLKASEQRIKVFEDRIKRTGIPIDSKFAEKKRQDKIKRKLGLSPKRITVLVSFGGNGFKAMRHISMFKQLLNLDLPLQFIVLAGYNVKFADKMRKIYGPNQRLKIYDYLDDVTDLFAASDLFLGKGGGLSISEAIAMKLPMLFVDKMPGQEEYNIDLIVELGLGTYVKNPASLVTAIKQYSKHRNKSKFSSFDIVARPHSSTDIALDIVSLTS